MRWTSISVSKPRHNVRSLLCCLRPFEAVEPERGRIHARVQTHDDFGHEPAGAWSDAEAMPRKAACDIETGNGIDRPDDRNGVRRHIVQSSPALSDLGLRESPKRLDRMQEALAVEAIDGNGDQGQDADLFERRNCVGRPGSRRLPCLNEAPADAKRQLVPSFAEVEDEDFVTRRPSNYCLIGKL